MTTAVKSPRKVIAGPDFTNPLTHDFMLETAAHLEVYADGVQLSIGTDYLVEGIGNESGYQVIILTPGDWPANKWVLYVNVPLDQPADVDLASAFATRFENALDGLARRIQKLGTDMERTLRLRPQDPNNLLAGRIPMIAADGSLTQIVNGPTVSDIEAAEGYAVSASESAAAAAEDLIQVAALVEEAEALLDLIDNQVTIPFPATKSALKAVDTSEYQAAYLILDGAQGLFAFRAGDYTSQIAGDPGELTYIKADDTAASAGAWVRAISEGGGSGIEHALTIDAIETTEIPAEQLALRPVGFSVVDPYASTWRRISTPDVPKPWHKQSADGQWWALSDHIVHPFMFGNVGKGSDDSQAFQDAIDFLVQNPADLVTSTLLIPAGEYEVDSLLLTGWASFQQRHYKVSGYGAKLTPRSGGTEAGTLLSILNAGQYAAMVEVEGLMFNQRSVNNLLYSIDIARSPNTKINRCYLSLGAGPENASRGIRLRQGDVNVPDTGSFWCEIRDTWIRKDGPTDIDYGIISQGANNHLLIENCKITVGDGTGILIQTNPGGTAYAANSVQLLRNAIEGASYGVHYATPANQRPYGLRSIGNRFEAVTYAHRFTLDSGSYLANQSIPVISDNIYVGVTAAVLNPNSALLDFQDKRNSSGLVTIANGASSATVSFPVAEFDANYNVLLRGNDTTLRISALNANGFTVARGATSGALTVQWSVVR